ncbi:FAD-dependent monooxygenase [Streptomyces sp. NPDC048361]|uniref:FAD-dependent oxidoreductase n=1 Tax=Streptomyces sp. NPDC048361 TaxID=3154720 RepID=UPI003413FC5E
MHEETSTSRPAAVVIGGGMTGMLAAAVLAEFADVTIVERDTLPEGPAPRKGLPQARHGHLLWSGGVKALHQLLPGIVDELAERGARRVPVMKNLVSKAPSGQWFRRFAQARHTNIVCSRDLLDATIRTEVVRDPRIRVRERTELEGLTGSADCISGVRIYSGAQRETLSADLVVDASGRGSRTPNWLKQLGIAPVPERTVDAGVGYASRMYRAPRGTTDTFPIVNVQADPRQPPGQGGIILPIEDHQWLVTLSGTRGGEPGGSNDEFVAFARALSHPIIGELLSGAEPLTDVVTTRSTANKRRYYESMPQWPAGFVVLGDAVAGYNPVYGHGLTVAAQCVVALRTILRQHDVVSPQTSRRIQQAVAGPVGNAWDLAVGQDIFYPGASDEPATRTEKLLSAFVDRAVDAGSRNPRAMNALLDVMSMEQPPSRLLKPDMLCSLLLGRKLPPLEGPPLTAAELKSVSC